MYTSPDYDKFYSLDLTQYKLGDNVIFCHSCDFQHTTGGAIPVKDGCPACGSPINLGVFFNITSSDMEEWHKINTGEEQKTVTQIRGGLIGAAVSPELHDKSTLQLHQNIADTVNTLIALKSQLKNGETNK